MHVKSKIRNSCQVRSSSIHTKFENEDNKKKKKKLKEKYQTLNHIKNVGYSLFVIKTLLSKNTCKLKLTMQFHNNKLCLAI
jgi:hypothetical protein